jgi:PAS domain S-box-containing protein
MTPFDSTFNLEYSHKIIQIIPNPVFIKDCNLNYVIVNDAFCTFFGIEKNEIFGKSDTLFFPRDECDGFWKIDRQILSAGIPVEKEETVTLQDGRIITVITRKSLLESHGNRFILGIVTDITEKTNMLQKIKEAESLYRSLIDSLPNLLLIHKKGRIQFANKAILERFGYGDEALKCMKITELFRDPKDKKNTGSVLKKFSTTNNCTDEIEVMMGNDPDYVNTFLLQNRMIIYEGNESVMSILLDITERKSIETYVHGKIIETEEKERRRFAADLHDDLGSLISSARLQLGFLERASGPVKFMEMSEKVYDVLEEMDRKIHFIIKNIVPGQIGNNGLGAAVKDLCDSIEESQKLSIELISNLNDFRFPKEIELHFYRIISELFNNSMKHSGATKVTLKMHRSSKMFRVWYSDNGKGYDIEKIPGKTSGLGITNIFYRANLINSDLNFEKKAGKVIVKISKRLE